MSVIGVKRLRLTHFRSYSYIDLSIDSKHVVLSGFNGAGKTNLLEAISFLSPGRGLRKAKISEVAQMGQFSSWAVHSDMYDGETPVTIATGQDPENHSRRLLKLQGVSLSKHSELTEILTINWMTPAMDRLFADTGSVRRKFFDRCVVGLNPEHADSLVKYEHAMRERSRLLKQDRCDVNWLATLESTMAAETTVIADNRSKALSLLTEAQPFSIDNLTFPAARLRFTAGVELQLKDRTAIELELELRHSLEANRQIDRAIGGSQVGAHKMDFTAQHSLKGIDARYCSTGEQKLLITWVLLAFVKLQNLHQDNLSILLLDEVAAHLDVDRRELLFQTLDTLDCQIWYSGTDASLFSSLSPFDHQLFSLGDSGIRKLI